MTLPRMFIFLKENGQYLSWTLTDAMLPNQTIDTATVVATLYQDRDLSDPVTRPGTPVTDFTNLNLPFVSAGVYRGLVPSSFNPEVGADYVLVVDATAPGYEPQHWEKQSVVEVRTQ
jgi:hypothetical protein